VAGGPRLADALQWGRGCGSGHHGAAAGGGVLVVVGVVIATLVVPAFVRYRVSAQQLREFIDRKVNIWRVAELAENPYLGCAREETQDPRHPHRRGHGLCLKNGYENTTVEQIAAAADVSPRTFSRYFATKDAVFLTLIEDYAHEVAIEFEKVPTDVGPLEAMRQAHVAVLTRVSSGRLVGSAPTASFCMLRVINASATLRQAAFEFRHDGDRGHPGQAQWAVDLDDRNARLVSVVFSATIVPHAGTSSPTPTPVRLGPTVMVDRLNEAFGQVAVMASDLHAPSPVDYEQVYG